MRCAYLEDKHAEDIVTRCPDTPEEEGGVDRSEEGTVQPTTTLRDELGYLRYLVSKVPLL